MAGDMAVSRTLVIALTAGGLAAGFVLAAFLVFAGATTPGATGAGADPVPPCPTGWSETPAQRCVPDATVCNAWFRTTADEAVSCEAEVPDGHGLITWDLRGTGEANVRVVDAAGKTVFSQAFTLTSEGETRVDGTRGVWRLMVEWEDVQGSGTVHLWGREGGDTGR